MSTLLQSAHLSVLTSSKDVVNVASKLNRKSLLQNGDNLGTETGNGSLEELPASSRCYSHTIAYDALSDEFVPGSFVKADPMFKSAVDIA